MDAKHNYRLGVVLKDVEPTHEAIKQLLRLAASQSTIRAFVKRYSSTEEPNSLGIESVYFCGGRDDPLFGLAETDGLVILYDGDLSKTAIDRAVQYKVLFVLAFHGGFDVHAKAFGQSEICYTVAAISKAAGVLVFTQTTRAKVEKLGLETPIVTARIPFDLSLIRDTSSASLWDIAFIGRPIPKKGLKHLLGAMKLLPSKWHLNVVGSASHQVESHHAEPESYRATYHGYLSLSQTLDVLGRSAYLVCPSVRTDDGDDEGIPQVLLWGMASGKPIVASATGSIPEIIAHGSTGLLVPPGDSKAIADALITLDRDPGLRERIRQGAIDHTRTYSSGLSVDTISHVLSLLRN